MPTTRSLHPFHREIDLHSVGLLGLRLLVVVAMVAASLFVVPLAPAAHGTPPPFDGWVYNAATDHYYKVVEGMSWQDAENAAVSYGGHLVTINDAAEEQWICANLGLSNYGTGFNDIASEGTWVWTSGESVGYTNWREHEPNDTGTGEDVAVVEDCPTPGWNDVSGSDWNVVEIPGGPAPVAEVTDLAGSVTVNGAAAHVGQIVREGETFQTDALSQMGIRTGTEQLDAVNEFSEGSEGTVTDNLTLDDFKGQIRTLVQNSGPDAYIIRTPISVIAVRGTDTTTDSSDTDATTRVDDGSVDVSTPDLVQTVTVNAGQSVDADAGGLGDPYVTSPNNTFGIDPQHDKTHGWNWAPNSSVTIQVDADDDPAAWLGEWSGIPTDVDGNYGFELPFDVEVGQYVRVMDESGLGYPDKETQVNPLTVAEPVAAGGTAMNGTGDESIGEVRAFIHGDPGEEALAVFAGSDWSATFVQVLAPGMSGAVAQNEQGTDDGDETHIWWNVPNPEQGFNVFIDELMVHAYQWPVGVDVSLVVQHSDGGSGWDPAFHTDSQVSGVAPWDSGQTLAEFVVPDTVGVGDLVTVSGDGIVKDHVVRGVLFVVDVDDDTVSGTGSPFADMNVNVNDDPGAQRHEVADGAGGFVADFSVVGDEDYEQDVYDLTVGTSGYVNESDEDGDQTAYFFGPPRNRFSVDPVGDQVWGGEWASDAAITVDVYESDGSTLKGTAGEVADGDGQFNVDLSSLTVPVDVVAGDVVEVTDGDVTKDHTVTGLELTGVDDVADTVSGLAALGSSVFVNIHESGVEDTEAVADGATGVWVATFAGLIDPGTQGYAYQPDVDGDQTQINWPAPPPEQNLNVFIDELMVHAYQWPVGVDVSLVVQHSDGGSGWDPAFHTDSQVSGVAPWDPGQTLAEFVVPDTVGVGDLVTVSGDGIVKDHVVRGVLFVVDVDDDTVSGTGSPFADMNVNVNDDPGAQRHEVADGAGGFVADFSVVGDEDYEQDVYDLTVGTSGYVNESDEDGDQTAYFFGPPRNSFRVDPVGDQIQGGQWVSEAEVTVSIAGAAGSPWTATADLNGDFWLDLAGVYDVVAGDVVEVTDGDVTKDHTVTGLELTGVDDVADTVSGLAALGSSVFVNIHESGVEDTEAVADGATGVWVATFAGLIDPGTQGYAYQPDVDGDQTQINWPAPPPEQNLNVFIDELMVHAYQWPVGVDVSLVVQHSDGGSGWDPAFHTDSQVSGVAPWDPGQTLAEFVVPDTVGVGDLVTVSGDGIVKDHVVRGVLFVVDVDDDTVSGTGSPFADMNVNVNDDPGAQRHEVADGAGGFVADFSVVGDEDYEQDVYDLTVGTSGYVNESDEDGDQTAYFFGPPRNRFSVDPVGDQVWGGEWASDAAITVDVYESDGSTLKGTAGEVADGDGQFNVDLSSLTVPVDVVAGDVVEVTDGDVTKDHTVTGLELTGVDDVADTVSGLAALGSSVFVNIHESGVEDTEAVADGATGVWVATFAGLIDPGTQGYAYQPDVDGDQTQINWPAPPPEQNLNVFIDELMVHAYQWPVGVDVSLVVQHSDGGSGWDPAFHTDSQVSGVAPWDPGQTLAEFVVPDTVGVGDLVTVSGDGIVKDHVVRGVLFVVDVDDDTVSGTGSPFADMNVNVNDDPGAQRHEVADGAGGFVADFSVVGDEDYEQDVYDLTVGTSGNVSESDEDGDQTTYFFGPPRNSFRVDPVGDQIQGGQWVSEAEVTVSIAGAAGSPWTATADLNGDFWLDLAGVYDVVAGDVVEVTDGDVTKDHTVTGLELTGVDDVADTVSGLAALGSSVFVNIHESGVEDTEAVADGATGVWVATFAGLIDPGTQGYAYQPDVDGDQTQINWPAQGTDSVAPLVSVVLPVNLSSVSGPVTVEGSASDDVGVDSVQVRVYDRDSASWWDGSAWQSGPAVDLDGVLALPGEVSSDWSYVFDLGSVPVSSKAYQVRARSFDAAGNYSAWSYRNFYVEPDSVAPLVSVVLPVNFSRVSGPVTVEGSASDDVGVDSVQVRVYDRDSASWWDGSAWQSGPAVDLDGVLALPGEVSSDWSYVFDLGSVPVSSKAYQVRARSFDAAGNYSAWSYRNFYVEPDSVAPLVSVVLPVNLSSVSGPVTVEGSASDDVGVDSVQVRVYDRDSASWWDGSAWQSGPAVDLDGVLALPGEVSSDWSYVFDLGSVPVSSKAYQVRARSFDAAGNYSAWSYRNFYVEPDSVAPLVSVVLPVNLSSVPGPVTVEGSASDDVGVDSVQVRVYDRDSASWWDGSAWQSGPAVDLDGVLALPGEVSSDWSYVFDLGSVPVSSKAYQVRARSFDAAGNYSAWSYRNFYVES